MQEAIGFWLILIGTLWLTVGLVWLVVLAFRYSWLYGVVAVITFPIGPLVTGLIRYRHSLAPLVCVLIGLVLGGAPFAYLHSYESLFGLGERERVIDGQRHLVLTGWDRKDYSILLRKPDLVVLEMGNQDVTDQTLQSLLTMSKLRELTLNDSSITDAGLSTLAKLPALESLRIARTKVTKDGIAAFLADPPAKLRQIDVTGCGAPSSVLRSWKNADPENRQYVN